MGNVFFRQEACDADASVDTLTFLPDDPRAPRFRLKHVAVGTAQESNTSGFCFYSRYVFLEVFTALQVIMALFTLYLFNYLGTMRYYYAPTFAFVYTNGSSYPSSSSSPLENEENYLQVSIPHNREALGPVYLTVVLVGIFFVVFLLVYILLINSNWWVSLEMERWERDQRTRVQWELRHNNNNNNNGNNIPSTSLSPSYISLSPERSHTDRHYNPENGGCRLRRLGVRWISWTRPYYVFSSRYLPDFDYRHELHARFGANSTRRNPSLTLFYFMAPFVLVLSVIDIMTLDEMRVAGVGVSFLQGLMVACGPLFLLYVMQIVFTGFMSYRGACCREMLGVL